MEQNGQLWKPPYNPMTIPELMQRIHDAGYPSEVIINEVDMAAMCRHIAANRDDEGQLYFWWVNTKVRCQRARSETLDLTGFRGNRIVSPS